METLAGKVNLLIEKTLEMENEQDLKIQQETDEALNPLYQSQPLPHFEEEVSSIKTSGGSVRKKPRYLSN